jgi:hypothetical protein
MSGDPVIFFLPPLIPPVTEPFSANLSLLNPNYSLPIRACAHAYKEHLSFLSIPPSRSRFKSPPRHRKYLARGTPNRTTSSRHPPSLLETINGAIHTPELAVFRHFSSTTWKSPESTRASPTRTTGGQRRRLLYFRQKP